MSSIETEDGIITVETETKIANVPHIHIEFDSGDHMSANRLDYESARALGWMLVGLTEAWAKNSRCHYRIEMNVAEEGGFIATVPSLPGCSAHGWSEDEARVEIRDAVGAWIESMKAVGNPIPEAP